MYSPARPGPYPGRERRPVTWPAAAFAMPAQPPRASGARSLLGSEATSLGSCQWESCSLWPFWLLGGGRTPSEPMQEDTQEPRPPPGRKERNRHARAISSGETTGRRA